MGAAARSGMEGCEVGRVGTKIEGTCMGLLSKVFQKYHIWKTLKRINYLAIRSVSISNKIKVFVGIEQCDPLEFSRKTKDDIYLQGYIFYLTKCFAEHEITKNIQDIDLIACMVTSNIFMKRIDCDFDVLYSHPHTQNQIKSGEISAKKDFNNFLFQKNDCWSKVKNYINTQKYL